MLPHEVERMKKTDEIYRSMMFVFLMNIFNTIIGLPFSIYGTFVLEERHGFNQQTPLFYVKDQIKKFIYNEEFDSRGIPPIVTVLLLSILSSQRHSLQPLRGIFGNG